MKKIFWISIITLTLMLMLSCQKGGKNSVEKIDGDIKNGAFLECGGFRYEIKNNGEDGYIFCVSDADGNVSWINEEPAQMRIKSKNNKDKGYSAPYTSCEIKGSSIIAVGEVKSNFGTVIEITDEYSAADDMIDLKRTAAVKYADYEDAGFSTVVSASYAGECDWSDYEYFIPAVIYKDDKYDVSNSYATYFGSKTVTVKDTNTSLPMVTCRAKNGDVLSVGRITGEISSDISDMTVTDYVVDKEYKVGSVGIMKEKTAAPCYIYPAGCEPNQYYTGTSQKRFYPLDEGFSYSYTVSLKADSCGDFNEAMTDSYRSYFMRYAIKEYKADMNEVRSSLVSLLDSYYGEKIFSGLTVCGIPFGAFVSDGHVEAGLEMEMGFVGMEISLAYQLMAYGLESGNASMVGHGVKMADMWAENAMNESGVPKTYIQQGGYFYPMPSNLRMMTDGMEGMLLCLSLADRLDSGNISAWESFVKKYAEFLVREQNADGSWYRYYDYGGKLFKKDNEYRLQEVTQTDADTKTSTPCAVRFLVDMYSKYGDERYLSAAKKAGDFVLGTLLPEGKYAGATCDGLIRTDRETGVYAMYAMNALYGATKEEKYLDAAVQAATYCLSWTMVYDYKVIDVKENVGSGLGEYFLNNAATSGRSFISSGHSNCDVFMAYTYYDFYRLYRWTGDEMFYKASLFLQNNTKQTVDWDGHIGYKKKGMSLEATDLSTFTLFCAGESNVNGESGVWLPWCSNACLEPAAKMINEFGKANIEELPDAGKIKGKQ